LCLADLNSAKQVASKILSLDDDRKSLVVSLLWAWWDAGNKANAGDKMLSTEEIIYKAKALRSDINLYAQKMQDKEIKLISAWIPPPSDILKINFDGAFSQEERKGGWGFIVRDHDGLAILAGAGRINFLHDALSAEIHGCLAALSVAFDQRMSHFILESDSTVLVRALQSNDYDFSAAGVLIRETKFLISMNFVHVDVVHAPRSCNSCAYELARVGLSWDPDQSYVWTDPLPEFVIFWVTWDSNEPVRRQ